MRKQKKYLGIIPREHWKQLDSLMETYSIPSVLELISFLVQVKSDNITPDSNNKGIVKETLRMESNYIEDCSKVCFEISQDIDIINKTKG